MLFLLFLYTVAQYILGFFLFEKLFRAVPVVFRIVGSFLLGVCVSIPLTYGISCFASLFTHDALVWGMIVVTFVSYGLGGYGIWSRHGLMNMREKPMVSDILFVFFAFVFSMWMMGKTFHGGSGQVFVGSNNVFDFGHLVGLIRSVSWGENIPFLSPFFANTPFFYHFFFLFWVALWEHTGVPLVYALNIPSALAFTGLLVVIYCVPQVLWHKGRLVGFIAVLLTITHSTLTWWHLLWEKGLTLDLVQSIWRLPTYPFRGPFDGSIISIYTTLNTYINQRHLAFGVSIGLLLYMAVVKLREQKKEYKGTSMLIGVLTGTLFLWNMTGCFLMGGSIIVFLLISRSFRSCIWFLGGYIGALGLSFLPYIPFITQTIDTIGRILGGAYGGAVVTVSTWTIGQYIWENFGIFPILLILGYSILSQREKRTMIPLLLFFVGMGVFACVGKRGLDQKLYSFLIIGANVVVAAGIVWLWERKTMLFRATALVVVTVVTLSGVIDLMPIKNEFAFPLISNDILPVMSWIQNKTPKDAVFVSYSDIIDPVVLAGRKNYFGFFGNVVWQDRSPVVSAIYAGDSATAKKLHVSYILVPKFQKNDFPYTVDMMYFTEHRMVSYEDDRYILYRMNDE